MHYHGNGVKALYELILFMVSDFYQLSYIIIFFPQITEQLVNLARKWRQM